MNKSRLYFIVIIFALSCGIPYKNHIELPSKDFKLNPKTIKSNGFYYREKTTINYCKSEKYASGMRVVKSSEFEEKNIEVLVFYTSGQIYHSGGLMISGINRNDENYFDYCNLVKSENTFIKAIEKYKYLVTNKFLDSRNGIFEKGVYNISQNKIKIQIYNSGSEVLQLFEYTGKILNDTTIMITKKTHINNNRTENVNQIYRFVEFGIKPDSSSYILENKSKFGK